MSTRSEIYVETEDGKHIGTYCHYDGYPSHMLPTLEGMSPEAALGHILVAMAKGGIRTLHSTGPPTEYFDDGPAEFYVDPDETGGWVDYVYVKQFDGKVRWRYSDESEWRFTIPGE